MASGFGLNGFEGRCYQFFRDAQQCLYTTDGDYKACGDHFEDYFECLHHKKEISRRNAILVHAHDRFKKEEEGGHG